MGYFMKSYPHPPLESLLGLQDHLKELTKKVNPNKIITIETI